MSAPMCVLDRNGDWHEVVGDLDSDAWSDKVRCGFVMLRFDHKRRKPTCIECRGDQ